MEGIIKTYLMSILAVGIFMLIGQDLQVTNQHQRLIQDTDIIFIINLIEFLLLENVQGCNHFRMILSLLEIKRSNFGRLGMRCHHLWRYV